MNKYVENFDPIVFVNFKSARDFIELLNARGSQSTSKTRKRRIRRNFNRERRACRLAK